MLLAVLQASRVRPPASMLLRPRTLSIRTLCLTPRTPLPTRCQAVVAPLPAQSGLAPGEYDSCGQQSQCGCTGSNTNTRLIKYHKTGSVLGQKLADSLRDVCAFDELQDAGVAPDPHRCSYTTVTIDENNYNHYPPDVLTNLSKAQPGLRLVHFIREPMRLIASYYTYHRMGNERDRFRYTDLWQRISAMDFKEGLLMVAALTMDHQLPIMVEMHELLKDRDDAIELNLEDIEASFDEKTSSLARHAGIASTCIESGSNLYNAFAEQDAARWSSTAKEMNSHITPGSMVMNKDAIPASTDASAGDDKADRWRQERLRRWNHTEAEAYELLVADEWASRKLKAFGVALGFEYPRTKSSDHTVSLLATQVDDTNTTCLCCGVALCLCCPQPSPPSPSPPPPPSPSPISPPSPLPGSPPSPMPPPNNFKSNKDA